MPTQVTNYQCPACTGPLHFSAETGKLTCDYCGSAYDVAEIEALYAQKEAEAAAAARITGEHPVLLLDDVLSELDEGRKQYLLTRMKEKQTFVTSCDDTAFLKTDGEVYRMNGGVLSRA